jgi:hypothetical protein
MCWVIESTGHIEELDHYFIGRSMMNLATDSNRYVAVLERNHEHAKPPAKRIGHVISRT